MKKKSMLNESKKSQLAGWPRRNSGREESEQISVVVSDDLPVHTSRRHVARRDNRHCRSTPKLRLSTASCHSGSSLWARIDRPTPTHQIRLFHLLNDDWPASWFIMLALLVTMGASKLITHNEYCWADCICFKLTATCPLLRYTVLGTMCHCVHRSSLSHIDASIRKDWITKVNARAPLAQVNGLPHAV